jgi:hypothetical protein
MTKYEIILYWSSEDEAPALICGSGGAEILIPTYSPPAWDSPP